ncbi:hypothetical protein WS46_32815 [Burkholderia sp. RF4-BP95]|nr:hypothetical protein WS46_32815 [Burkholderia sp. RF4-BP95]
MNQIVAPIGGVLAQSVRATGVAWMLGIGRIGGVAGALHAIGRCHAEITEQERASGAAVQQH